jgi:hypothetical protein
MNFSLKAVHKRQVKIWFRSQQPNKTHSYRYCKAIKSWKRSLTSNKEMDKLYDRLLSIAKLNQN